MSCAGFSAEVPGWISSMSFEAHRGPDPEEHDYDEDGNPVTPDPKNPREL